MILFCYIDITDKQIIYKLRQYDNELYDQMCS